MSEITNTCFDNIIGISRTDCECFDFTDDDKFSDSGLYLFELDPLNATWVKGREDCERGEVAEIARNAREQAVISLKNDLLNEMLQYNELKRSPYKGSIGKFNYTGNRNLTDTYAEMVFFCADVIGGLLKIKDIKTVFNNTTSFVIWVYNNLGELVGTYPVDSLANQLHSNPVDIVLPMHSEYVDNLVYHFVYSSSGMTPKNISLQSCGTWNTREPYCNRGCSTFVGCDKGWESWLMVSGFQRDDLDFVDCNTPFIGSFFTNGLILDIELSCKCEDVICTDAFDFTGNTLAMNVAIAVRYKAAVNLILSMLGDTEISRLTVMNKETLANFMNLYEKEYNKLILSMAKNIDIGLNDCYQCRDFYGMTKSGIFS